MVELGADLIKCFLTDDFQDAVDNLSVPAFTIGAEKLDNDLDVLKKAETSVAQGVRGIIFGRNIFMSDNPKGIVGALNSIINDGVSPSQVVDAI